MVSEKDFNSAELETMRTSRSPTTVMTANGEVQTREEATVHVGVRLKHAFPYLCDRDVSKPSGWLLC